MRSVDSTTSILVLIIANIYALRIGDPCSIKRSSIKGSCLEPSQCFDLTLVLQNTDHELKDLICGWRFQGNRSDPFVCCPDDEKLRNLQPKINASAPLEYYTNNKGCKGSSRKRRHVLTKRTYGLFNRRRKTPAFHFIRPPIRTVSGGHNAESYPTAYMALFGKKTNTGPDWFCDGVLINSRWTLTAAHCLVRIPDVVRLGEYDTNTNGSVFYDDPIDYGVKQIVIYPKYNFPEAYHDLALVELSSDISHQHKLVRPICLPWSDTNEHPNLHGTRVTLTGWGSTVFGGRRSSVLQQVDLTIFNIEICRKSYSNLTDFDENWPQGMKSDSTLCAGDIKGGKDACDGDSGGPIVYRGRNKEILLAGLVSKGFGCGLKEFPGIYTHMHNPAYLNWIKQTAF